MGCIFRKSYTAPLPPDADIVEQGGKRIARWRLKNGKMRSGEVVDSADGRVRVRGQSRQYWARYRDGGGQTVEILTGCKDEIAARAVLTQHERHAELIRAGVMSAEEIGMADHATRPLRQHLDIYEQTLRARGNAPRRIAMLRCRLDRLLKESGILRLNKIDCEKVETWLADQADRGLSAATRNGYRESLVGFGNWCVRTGRLPTNPFLRLPRADQRADRRHQRRALTADELQRLLTTARLRPLAELGRQTTRQGVEPIDGRKTRATWKKAALRFDDLPDAAARAETLLAEETERIESLRREGLQRSLIYKTLAMTGLRKGELASLTVTQLELDTPTPHVVLYAADAKNRRDASLPLRADLVADLRDWLATRLATLQEEARRWGEPIPVELSDTTPLFAMPTGLTRIFDRDLAAAGIAKRDARDRVVDIHALRVTFCTHLCAAGVPLRTAQAAMRHSKPELTAAIYTDPELLDVAGAMASLPDLSVTQPAAIPAPQQRQRA